MTVSALQVQDAARIMREELHRAEPVYLYAIQAGENGPIKIGLATDPAQRLKTLQTANAEILRGLAAWRALPLEEKLVHDEFAHAQIRGEWFRPTPDLLDYVLSEGASFCDWGQA